MKSTLDKSMDVQPDRLKNLLKDLVNIYSPTGKEGEILKYVAEYLKSHNLLPEEREEIGLCFVGHLDTITAHDLEDFGFHEEGDTILGLGTADMKAGCAAMMEAFTVLANKGGCFPPVGLALVVGEEEDSDGAKTLVREFSFPWAVVGEPTNIVPCLGHYGYLEVLLRTRGKRAHSSMPELGKNAIETMRMDWFTISGNFLVFLVDLWYRMFAKLI